MVAQKPRMTAAVLLEELAVDEGGCGCSVSRKPRNDLCMIESWEAIKAGMCSLFSLM